MNEAKPNYGIERTINFGKYSLPYESIVLHIEGCASWKEAEEQIKEEAKKIHDAFMPLAKARLEKLTKKSKLTFKEEEERETLRSLTSLPPF